VLDPLLLDPLNRHLSERSAQLDAHPPPVEPFGHPAYRPCPRSHEGIEHDDGPPSPIAASAGLAHRPTHGEIPQPANDW